MLNNKLLHNKLFLPILAISIVLFCCCYGLSSYGLANNNEGLYAEIAREMLVLHNFIIPHLNYVVYLEKPPLLYWLLAFNYHWLGVTTLAARLVPSLSAVSICLSFIYFGRSIQQARAGYLAALLLATSFGFALLSRIVFFDMLLTCFITLSLLCFYIWFEQAKKSYLRSAYAFLAAAILTKGLISFLCIPIVLTVILVARPGQRVKTLREFLDIPGILLFLLLVMPWHIIAVMQHPGFFWEYIVNQQFLRFFGLCEPYDYYSGPIYYYIPRIFICFFPWSFLLVSLLFHTPLLAAVTARWGILFKNFKNSPEKNLKIFLWVWFLVPFLVFSISQAKANYYMLIGMPPLALLLGLCINDMIANKNYQPLFYTFISALVILLLGLGIVYKFQPLAVQQLSGLFYAVLTCILISLIASGLIVIYSKHKVLQLFLLICLFSSLSIGMLVRGSAQLQTYFSSETIAQYIQQHDNQRVVYLYQDYENLSSIPFYLQRRLPIINNQSGDLAYGAKDPAVQQWFITDRELLRINRQQRLYIIVAKEHLADVNKLLAAARLCQLFSDKKAVLLSNVSTDCAAKDIE